MRHNLTKSVRFITVLTLFTVIVVLTGCLKNDKVPLGPTEIPVPPIFIKITDQTTGQDLIIGAEAPYHLTDVALYRFHNQTLDTSVYQKFGIDSIKNCLVAYLNFPFQLLKIGDMPADTITVLSSKTNQAGNGYIDSILLNGHKYAADNQQIFQIKK